MNGYYIESDCGTIYFCHIPECPLQDKIKVLAGLTPATAYNWIITDKFGNAYHNESITDAQGDFEILLSHLPDQLLTAHSGTFKLQLREGLSDCNYVAFDFCDKPDTAIVKTVVFTNYSSTPKEAAFIGCECE